MRHNIFSILFKLSPRRARDRHWHPRLRCLGRGDLYQWSDRSLSDIGCWRDGDRIGVDADF